MGHRPCSLSDSAVNLMASSATLSALFTAVSYFACRSWITSLGPLHTWWNWLPFNVFRVQWFPLMRPIRIFHAQMQLCFGDHTNLSCPRCSCRWPPGGWRQTLHYWSLMGWVGILIAIWRTDRDQKSIISLTVSADSFYGRCFGYGHDGPPRVALLWRTLSNTPNGKKGPKSSEHNDPKLPA